MKNIAVIGLGYVGLPVALLASEKGYNVTGFDINLHKIHNLQAGRSYINDIPNEIIESSSTTFTSEASDIKNLDTVIICVPTPVTSDKQPDLRPIRDAIKTIAPYLKKQALVVLESTVNPGVCDEIIIPLIESKTRLKVGEDIYLAHCPERINPGDPSWDVSNINRVIGANTAKELRLAKNLYESLIDAEIKPMASLKEAEAVKIVENSFRDINIAFVNELAMSFHKLGINVENVIDGAATKPFAFMAHHPGCGVGGHCIPVDPYYLIDYANDHGFNHELLRLARNINNGMPQFTVELLENALNDLKKPLKGTKVALLGISYKPNVGDDRESPAYRIKHLLEIAGVDLAIYDPCMRKSSTLKSLDEALQHAEAIVLATAHKEFLALNAETCSQAGVKVFVDGRNALKNMRDSFRKNNVAYCGIGL